MSTRSRIGVSVGSSIVSVYVHSDGYLRGVGKTLYENYNNEELANELVSYGDISQLGSVIGTQHNFNDRSVDQCTFYKRDRNEYSPCVLDSSVDEFLETAENCDAEYYYLWTNGAWFVGTFRAKGLTPLKEALCPTE
jgi:hypothetical protein